MPADVAAATTDLAQNKLGLKYVPKIFVVDSVLWCALLGICTRYFQCTVESNRLYNYIQSIEAELKALFAGAPFTREGDFYSNNYNLFKRWAGFVYTVIFPLFMCITIVVKMVSEIIIRESIANALFDLAICAIVLISIVLFVWRDLIVQFGRKQE
ncbi:MAG: hypothetical protein H6847_03650 [Hyphomonas sp.]|nr:hypothetical protein [Hyphomonas sp.]